MRKIGKLNQFLSALIVCLCFASLAHAQEVEVSASLSQTNLYPGERAMIEIAVSGTSLSSVNRPQLPPIDGLRWLQGSQQRGTNINYRNGERYITYTFGYMVIAQQTGSYTIPSLEVSVNDQVYRTEPVNFRILDQGTAVDAEDSSAPDIYVRLEPTTKEPVVGQQVVADIVLYFRDGIDVSSYRATPGWKAEGFWKEELQNPQRAQTSSQVINGIRYQRAHLLQYALFPTKTGELTLSPFEITVSVRQQRRSNSIFDMNFNQQQMPLETPEVTLDVQPLPELDDAGFSGAVGDFEITRSITPDNAMVGESIEITTRIEGSGNVPLINKPEYEYPEGLELYNPQENSSISRTQRRISGFKTYTDIVIARNEGTYTIPEKRIASYNPRRNGYEITVLPELTFTAQRDPNSAASGLNQLRLDVKPITGLAQWTSASHTPLHEKAWVWTLLILPLLITGGAFAYKNYHERLNTDTAFARSQNARTKAMATLSEAENSDDIKTGYHLIEKALTQFITDKLNLPPAGLSSQKIVEEVSSRNPDTETVNELKRLFSKCETIAYAPNATQAGMENDVEKTRALIKTIGKVA